MDENASPKWRHLLLFIGGTFISVGVLLYLAELYFPNTASTVMPHNDHVTRRFFKLPNWATLGFRPLYDPATQTITLRLNESFEIEGLRVTYRGLSDKDTFNLEVRLLAFDRETPFHYRLPIDQAKEEFQLARRKFRLISAKRNRFAFRHQFETSLK